jgi:hypothetical protein
MMDSLPTAKIYKIAGSLLLFLMLIAFAVGIWERSLRANLVPENAPVTSAIGEVEFESGATATQLRAQQLKDLYSRAPAKNGDVNFIQVPIADAIDELLRKGAKP